MANVSVYNIEGKEVGSIELNDAVFGVEINEHLVHMAVVNQLANNRQGTQSAKTRSEVSGGGRKPVLIILDRGDFRQLPNGNDLLHQALQQSLRSLHFTARHHICHDKILNGIPIHNIIRICKKKRALAAADAKLTHNDITAVAKGFLHHLFIFLQLLLYLHPFSPPTIFPSL